MADEFLFISFDGFTITLTRDRAMQLRDQLTHAIDQEDEKRGERERALLAVRKAEQDLLAAELFRQWHEVMITRNERSWQDRNLASIRLIARARSLRYGHAEALITLGRRVAAQRAKFAAPAR